MFNLSKSFVIFLILSILLWIGLEDVRFFYYVMGGYAIVKFIWNLLTK